MSRRFIPLVFLLFSISWAAVSAQDCPELVKTALSRAQTACAIMRGNQACYGYQTLDAQLQAGLSPFAFNGVGDITPVDTIESLHMSALNPVTDEWGVALMRVRADISADQPNENVTLLAFGEVTIDPDKSGVYQPMQAFALQTGDADSGCTDITENGLIIQTPEGVGRVTLWINDVRVRVGSTVLFQAQPGGDLIVSTFEGHAEVEANGGTQEAETGMRVRVPLDADMHPAGAPTIPEAFDVEGTGLTSFVDVATTYTDGTVVQFIPTNVPPTSVPVVSNGGSGGNATTSGNSPVVNTNPPVDGSGSSGDSTGSSGDTGQDDNGNSGNNGNGGNGGHGGGGGCNGDHGNGNGNGNCNGHDNGGGNGNHGHGNGNGGGHGGGHGHGG